jgi:hypothetical protein
MTARGLFTTLLVTDLASIVLSGGQAGIGMGIATL